MYAALDVETAVAETFQTTRRVDLVSAGPRLTGDWALRNGAAHALASHERRVCRSWARQIRQEFDDLDGLRWASTMTGRESVVLWAPAARTFPSAPAFSENLVAPQIAAIVVAAAQRIGYER